MAQVSPFPSATPGPPPGRSPGVWRFVLDHWTLLVPIALLFLLGILMTVLYLDKGSELARADEEVSRLDGALSSAVGEISRLEADNVAAEDQISGLEARVTDLESENAGLSDQVGRLDEREAELDARATSLDERQAELDARERRQDERERGLDARAAAVTVVERRQFSDGLFKVGLDIQSGTYHTEGGSSCYWAKLGADDNDIIDNFFGNGPLTVVINAAWFESNGCGTWTPV
ncbi:hypothetical protein BH20ACT21_BH20ACT21_26230 [soil metagenome]